MRGIHHHGSEAHTINADAVAYLHVLEKGRSFNLQISTPLFFGREYAFHQTLCLNNTAEHMKEIYYFKRVEEKISRMTSSTSTSSIRISSTGSWASIALATDL